MTTVAQVRTQLAAIASGISGWRGEAYLGEQVNPPVVKVTRGAYDPRYVHADTTAAYKFTLLAYWVRGAGDAGEAALDAVAPLLVAAVQDSANWGAVDVEYAQVTQVGEVAVAQWLDSVEYFVLPVDVEVVF